MGLREPPAPQPGVRTGTEGQGQGEVGSGEVLFLLPAGNRCGGERSALGLLLLRRRVAEEERVGLLALQLAVAELVHPPRRRAGALL